MTPIQTRGLILAIFVASIAAAACGEDPARKRPGPGNGGSGGSGGTGGEIGPGGSGGDGSGGTGGEVGPGGSGGGGSGGSGGELGPGGAGGAGGTGGQGGDGGEGGSGEGGQGGTGGGQGGSGGEGGTPGEGGAGGSGGTGGSGGEGGRGGDGGSGGSGAGGSGGEGGGGGDCDGAEVTEDGECRSAAAGLLPDSCCLWNCDKRDVFCRRLPPVCDPGQTASVVGICWGPCVPSDRCLSISGAEVLCEESGGTWDPGGCGHTICGESVDCIDPVPGCNCGVESVFDEEVGCVLSDDCVPKSEEDLCNATDGEWLPFTCGHWGCGNPPFCDAIIPGCNCGKGRSFGDGAGCFEDAACGK